MSSPPPLELPRLRCAPFHQELQVDPIGSAAHNDAFLCVEVPLPWERDIGLHEPFASLPLVVSAGDGTELRWRPLGLVPQPLDPARVSEPSPTSLGALRRVIAYAPPRDATDSVDAAGTVGIGRLGRDEWLVGQDDLAGLCAAIVTLDAAALARFDDRRVEHADDVVDLLVCTHGRRDTCCGGPGTTMFEALAGRDRSVPGSTVRVWRTSHLGGHRFAPTMVSFPDAYAWAHLDVGSAVRIAQRDGDAVELAQFCRGRSTVPGGAAQVAERVGLERHGWAWLDARAAVEVVAFDRTRVLTTVRVAAAWPDGAADIFEVDVAVADHVPQPTCGVITGPEYKVEPVWSVLDVRPAR